MLAFYKANRHLSRLIESLQLVIERDP